MGLLYPPIYLLRLILDLTFPSSSEGFEGGTSQEVYALDLLHDLPCSSILLFHLLLFWIFRGAADTDVTDAYPPGHHLDSGGQHAQVTYCVCRYLSSSIVMSILSESFFFRLSIHPGTTWPEPACLGSRSRASARAGSIVGHYQLRKKLPCSGCWESARGRCSRGWSPSPRRPSLTSGSLRSWVERPPTSRPPTQR